MTSYTTDCCPDSDPYLVRSEYAEDGTCFRLYRCRECGAEWWVEA